MYSISNRFNKIFYTSLYLMVILCALNYFTGIFMLKKRDVKVEFKLLDII